MMISVVPATGLRIAAALFFAAWFGAAPARAAGDVEAGRRIYEAGILIDGSALAGTRWDSAVVSGAQAACAQCHRASGMGSVEGDIQAPPVTGNALFGTGDKVVATMDPRSGKAFNQAHEPYTDESIARALRSGLHGDGRPMNVLMPRYALRDADLAALVAYLRQLSVNWSPGVTKDQIRFATVITPDVPPARRALFEDMVRKMVAQKNGSTMVAGHGSRHHMTSAAELVLGTERKWALDIWQLQGPPQTWAEQLDRYYARQPVFALVSGLGGDDWSPVDAFCDRQSIPCWFPSVELPPAAAPRYSIYFSAGVSLEAQVLAAYLRAPGAQSPRRVVQVFRDGTLGRGAARALAAALDAAGAVAPIPVENRPLADASAAELNSALAGLTAQDAVMFWLGPDDVATLGKLPPPAAAIYFSGDLGRAGPGPREPAWRERARIVYPYELPDRRAANLAYFHSWLNQRHLPLEDEITQSEVYFAFAFLTDTVSEMLDNVYRDYLIERAENMISRREGGKAEAEYYSSTQSHVRTHSQTADGHIDAQPNAVEAPGLQALRLAGTSFGKREGTSAYPRLALGPGQRFASKGGYIAHYDAAGVLAPDSPWIVP